MSEKTVFREKRKHLRTIFKNYKNSLVSWKQNIKYAVVAHNHLHRTIRVVLPKWLVLLLFKFLMAEVFVQK